VSALAPRRPRGSAERLSLGLGFDRAGGPLVAVCATRGGAGASTVAALLGVAAARESAGAVLACDAGGPTAGLSLQLGVGSALTLCELAEAMADGMPPSGAVFARGPNGLRVVASGPRFRPSAEAEGLELTLAQARAAHALTLVDCGTLGREAEQLCLSQATHVVWVADASPAGAEAAERFLRLVRPLDAREAVIVRSKVRAHRPPFRRLARLAASRGGPLVLLPELSAPIAEDPDAALERAQTGLVGLARFLNR
jgi:MinD-like ATPase involved in chromosome partitioning or flagellar assembly